MKSNQTLEDLAASYSRDGESRVDFAEELKKVAQQTDQHVRGQLTASKRVLILLQTLAIEVVALKNSLANQNDTVLELRREIESLRSR